MIKWPIVMRVKILNQRIKKSGICCCCHLDRHKNKLVCEQGVYITRISPLICPEFPWLFSACALRCLFSDSTHWPQQAQESDPSWCEQLKIRPAGNIIKAKRYKNTNSFYICSYHHLAQISKSCSSFQTLEVLLILKTVVWDVFEW